MSKRVQKNHVSFRNRILRKRHLQLESLEDRRVMAYADVVLGDGPVAYYRLDDAALPAAVDSAGNFDGAYQGFLASDLGQAGALLGDANTAARFDGADNLVAVPHDPALAITGDFTAELWMFKTSEAGDWQRMVGMGADPATGAGNTRTFGIWEEAGGGQRVLFQQYNAAGAAVVNFFSASNVPLNTWTHVVATVSGSTASIYLNGKLDATATRSGAAGVSLIPQPLTIGAAPTLHTKFPGKLDEVAIYSKALTAAEVAEHYAHGVPQLGVEGTPVNFSQPLGIAYDAVGQGSYSLAAGSAQGNGSAFASDPSKSLDLNNDAAAPDSYVLSSNLTSLFVDDSATLSVWFQADGSGVVVAELGTAAVNAAWHDSQIEVVNIGGGLASVRVRVWNTAVVDLGTIPLGNGAFHHAVLRYDEATNVLDGFLDGVQSGSITQDRARPTENGYQQFYVLGSRDSTTLGSGAPFNGAVDDFSVYNAALTNAEVAALYAARTAPNVFIQAVVNNPGPDPVVYWRLDEVGSLTAVNAMRNPPLDVTVNYGDGSAPVSFIHPNSTIPLSLAHAYADDGDYTVTISTTNTLTGAVRNYTQAAHVDNVDPAATITGPATGLPGESLAYTFKATDAGSADQASLKFEIDFGDGATTTVNGVNGAIGAIRSHVYEFPGSYTIELVATDNEGGTDTATFNVEIVPVRVVAGDVFVGGTPEIDRIVVAKSGTGMLVTWNGKKYPLPTASGDITVHGHGGNDIITIGATLLSTAYVYGGADNDYIAGGGGADELFGEDGHDRVLGGAGANTLDGGEGNDTLSGGANDETLLGGAGDDTLNGNGGQDVLQGGEDNDILNGGVGNDTLEGEDGDDKLDGGAGHDVHHGGAGGDRLYGRAGHDILVGGDDVDALYGYTGDDLMIGEETIYDAATLYATYLPIWITGSLAARIAALDDDFTSLTVNDDGASDTLYGERDNDWFLFAKDLDVLRDLKSTDKTKEI